MYSPCADAWNLASHPIPLLSGLLHVTCCPSALQRGLAGSLSFPALAWLHVCNILQTVWNSSSGTGQTANPALLLAVCCPWSIALPLPSPAFVPAAQAEKLFGQRLILNHVYAVLCEWRPEVSQFLWVPRWILMVPKACSDRWDLFIKCSWVCMWNKLDCGPYRLLCLNGLVHWWCNLGENAGSKVPAFNRIEAEDFTVVMLQGCWLISYAATSKPVSLMRKLHIASKWNESQKLKVLLCYLLKC